MSQDLTLAMRLLLNAQQWTSGLTSSRNAVNKFVSGARSEFGRLQSAYQSVTGRIAALGVGVGATATIIQSAQLDKALTQIKLTAGASAGELETLRNELFALSKQTGTPVADLQAGFNDLIQSGLNWQESLRVIRATNQATAVTNANVSVLTKGLSVAGAAFNFDLSQPQMALNLLDKMVVAGRLGNAELENLSSIFARVGVNANSAGMSFDKTLAFIESLSMVEREPERLATLADSTLRIFTNARYVQSAQAGTGVRFFDASGTRRDALDVLKDIKGKYDKLTTDAQRNRFISRAFQNADLDTIKGLRTLLGGDMLTKMSSFTMQIGDAAGTLKRDLPEAINNSVNQVGRLKASLREAADGFAKPINDSITKLSKYALDGKKDGGLGLSGGQIAAIGAGALVGGYVLKRTVGGLAGNLLGTAGGVAAGKALEATAGVTPVFVTNWQDGSGNGIAGAAGAAAVGGAAVKVLSGLRLLSAAPLGIVARMGAGVITGAAGMVGAAGLAGYGAGTLISKAIEGTRFSDALGEKIARALAAVGNDNASAALASRARYDREFQGTLKIELASNDMKAQVREFRSNSPSLNIDLDHRGPMMVLP